VHSFIEQILLPPWSNWFLAALGLIIPALVDSREQREKKPPSGEEHSKEQKQSTILLWQSLWRIFRTSLGLSLILVAGILLVISAIWWPVERESGGWWNFVVMITGLLMIFIFIWRTLDLDLPLFGREPEQDKPKWQRVLPIIIIVILLLIGVCCTQFPLLKPLMGISLVAGVLEILRATPWLFKRIKKAFVVIKNIGGKP